ncbi:MAG: F0F1 ATP synthase subunit epsilon [Betaproteobacteria bacterium]|nr:F0F1 ATP synthase subunit epsilon [Betaproteobacteria bacterium]
MPGLTVEVITAERKVVTDEADMVIAPTTEGVIGILPRHAPLLTRLAPGVMVLKKGGAEQALAIAGGFLEVNRNRVLVLADAAEREDEIDEERAALARAHAEEALREAARHPSAVQSEAARTALRRSLARLDVVQRKRRRRPIP